MPRHGHRVGGVESPTYSTWRNMRRRCAEGSTALYWPTYLDVIVCDRWESFANFLADVGERPPGHTLHRLGNKGNYEPGNVEWRPAGTH